MRGTGSIEMIKSGRAMRREDRGLRNANRIIGVVSANGNYSGVLIGRPIAILYFLARKITAECAEERRVVNRLFPLRVLCG
jgi:hypothetical protein